MKSRVKYVLMLITVFASTVFPAMGENEPVREHFKLFGQCRQIFKATAEDKLAFLSELAKLPEVSEAVTAEVELLKVRLLIDLEKYDEAMAIIQKYTTSYQEVMPEWYYMNIHILQQEKKIEGYDIATYTPLVKVIPFSWIAIEFERWHFYLNQKKFSEKSITSTAYFVFKPMPLETYKITVISELYVANNMINRARDINLIMLYSCYPFQTTTSSILNNKRFYFDKFTEKGIIATPVGQSLWRFVGQVECRNKNHKLALIAFLRAAYDEPNTADALYKEWLQPRDYLNSQDAQYMDAEDAEYIARQFSYIVDKSNIMTDGDFFPWALDALRESKTVNHKLIAEYVDIFKKTIEWQSNVCPDYRYLGVPAKDITDYENFHIPTPSETFWREDLLYVPKK